MRVSRDYLERGYIANLHRRRAEECGSLADKAMISARKAELDDERDWNLAMALSLDEGEDDVEDNARRTRDLIVPTKDIDIRAVDGPGVKRGIGAS